MQSHEWTKKQSKMAQKPNYSKLYVVKPALIKLLGKVKNKKILELGCGNGYWLRLLAKNGAECTGIDNSKNQLELAKRESPEKIKYILGDITKKIKLKKNYYDLIFLEHVLLEISTLKKIKNLFRGAYKLTKKGGFIIVSDANPVALNLNLPNIEIGKDYSYFKRGYVYKIASRKPDGEIVRYSDYHYPLEDIANSITDAGFKITKIIEPRPTKKQIRKIPYFKYRENKPGGIMIKAQKI